MKYFELKLIAARLILLCVDMASIVRIMVERVSVGEMHAKVRVHKHR